MRIERVITRDSFEIPEAAFRGGSPVSRPVSRKRPFLALRTAPFRPDTPVKSPQRCGARISEAVVNTPKRDYENVTPLPEAATVLELFAGWFEDTLKTTRPPG